ncbi:collagen alpha-2(I) chain-like [Eubalaena glacialis]|uniref:collagen alpha-2(I) chain-like n=1 Tax=Eubalaena glacialis TaxID=27606 RepID=UPI002A5A61D4|nr:collagen alpha-2(I) chain-like [Eubalaena glacialis]XP_061026447.1 collagen alpha-2(I) chain-like [Eubalaena glacialis]
MKLPNPAGPNIPSGVQGGRGPGLRRRTAAPGTPETRGRERPVRGGGPAAEGDPGPGHSGPVPAPASSRLFALSLPRVSDTHGPVTVTGRRARAGPGLGRGCGPERPPGLEAARLPGVTED